MDVFLEALEFLYEEASFLAWFLSVFKIFQDPCCTEKLLNFQTSSSNVSTLSSTLNDNASDMLIRRKRSSAVAPPRPALVAGRGGGVLLTIYTFTLTIWETIWFTMVIKSITKSGDVHFIPSDSGNALSLEDAHQSVVLTQGSGSFGSKLRYICQQQLTPAVQTA